MYRMGLSAYRDIRNDGRFSVYYTRQLTVKTINVIVAILLTLSVKAIKLQYLLKSYNINTTVDFFSIVLVSSKHT